MGSSPKKSSITDEANTPWLTVHAAPTVMAALVVSLLTTPNGELIAGVPEIVGLVGTAVVAKVSGNHILALLTGMTTYWLIGWIM